MTTSNLTSQRTLSQRLAHRRRLRENGKPSLGITIFLYALLLALIVVDFTVLTDAFVILNQSQGGASVQDTQEFVVIALSIAAVALPHVAAWGFQRRSLGLLAGPLTWVPWAAVGLWGALVGLMTYVRLVAASTPIIPKEDNTVIPGATPDVVPTVPVENATDITQVILAFVMLLVLLVSAIISYVAASVLHHPLRSWRHKAAGDVASLDAEVGARQAELDAARRAAEAARREPERDQERLEAAIDTLDARADGLRAEVRTILAASLGSPDATSHLIRELRRRYPTTPTNTI